MNFNFQSSEGKLNYYCPTATSKGYSHILYLPSKQTAAQSGCISEYLQDLTHTPEQLAEIRSALVYPGEKAELVLLLVCTALTAGTAADPDQLDLSEILNSHQCQKSLVLEKIIIHTASAQTSVYILTHCVLIV